MISNIPPVRFSWDATVVPRPKFEFGGKALIRNLVQHAASLTGEPVAAITGESRQRELFIIRCAVIYVARQQGRSFPVIGRALKRDHSSAVHAFRRAQDMIVRDPQFAAFVQELEASL